MTEPFTVPVAVGISVAGGYILGMPTESVAIGAIASLAVLVNQDKKSIIAVISYTIIGGLLGGSIAPILGHWLVETFSSEHEFMNEKKLTLINVFSPAVTGLGWQFLAKLLVAMYPSLERRFDELISAALDFILRRPRK